MVVITGAGVYSVTSLNPGVYDVSAEAKGFKSAVVKNLRLEVNANVKQDLVLQLGTATQTVEVIAA